MGILDKIKKLRRVEDGSQILAGVFEGMSKYWNLNPMATRILFVTLLLIYQYPIILLYLIMWAMTPPESEE